MDLITTIYVTYHNHSTTQCIRRYSSTARLEVNAPRLPVGLCSTYFQATMAVARKAGANLWT